MPSLLFYSALLSSLGVVLAQTPVKSNTIVNNCPTPIDLYIAGAFDSTLATGASKVHHSSDGFFYTTANGGHSDGRATRVGFYDSISTNNDPNLHIYYIVKDVDYFNVGISVAPDNHPAVGDSCGPATCEDVLCSTAFNLPPRFRFPGPTAVPPEYRCPFDDTTYTITFCPSGAFPTDSQLGRPINFNHDSNWCLDVRGAVYANETPVQLYECNNTGAQRWIIKRGSTKVRVAGRNFCLDAGTVPASGVGMKIYQCYDNLPAQQWVFTDDNRIAVEGKGQCLDLPNGVMVNSNQAQTWQCSDNNNNQVWTAATI